VNGSRRGDPGQRELSRRHILIWAAPLVACLLGASLRLLLVALKPDGQVPNDWYAHQDVVRALMRGELPAGFFVFPPGFFLVSAPFGLLTGPDLAVRIVTVLSGLALLPLTWGFARRWGPRVAFLATLMVALDFGLIHWGVQVSRTLLAACALLAGLWAWTPGPGRELTPARSLGAGALTVLAVLTRTEQLLVLVVALPLFQLGRFPRWRQLAPGLVVVALGLGGYAGLMKARTGVLGLSPNHAWTVAAYLHPDRLEQQDRLYWELVAPDTTRWEAFLADPSSFKGPGLLGALREKPERARLIGQRLVDVLVSPERYYTLHYRAPLATWAILLLAGLGTLGARRASLPGWPSSRWRRSRPTVRSAPSAPFSRRSSPRPNAPIPIAWPARPCATESRRGPASSASRRRVPTRREAFASQSPTPGCPRSSATLACGGRGSCYAVPKRRGGGRRWRPSSTQPPFHQASG
jgi:hypothetical protein